MKKTIATNLVRLRKMHRLTTQQVANDLNISIKSICCYERERAFPPIEKLQAFATYYGYKIDDLLNENLEIKCKKLKPVRPVGAPSLLRNSQKTAPGIG